MDVYTVEKIRVTPQTMNDSCGAGRVQVHDSRQHSSRPISAITFTWKSKKGPLSQLTLTNTPLARWELLSGELFRDDHLSTHHSSPSIELHGALLSTIQRKDGLERCLGACARCQCNLASPQPTLAPRFAQAADPDASRGQVTAIAKSGDLVVSGTAT